LHHARHLIGSLEPAPLENVEFEAKTAFLVNRSHLETNHQLLSGCREDLLRKVNGAWKVARRTRTMLSLTSCPPRPAAGRTS
jgi:hypothetical protein